MAAALTAALWTVTAVGAAGPAAGAGCSPGSGVTLVIDFPDAGGNPADQVFCIVNGAGRTAESLMAAAGVDVDRVQSGQPFVCRINDYPSDDTESCQGTPPANAYWGLFASDGSPAEWSYSTRGYDSTRVPDGGSIGWAFQDGGDRDNPSPRPTKAAAEPEPRPEPRPKPKPEPKPEPSPKPTAQPGPSSSSSPTSSPSSSASAEAAQQSDAADEAATKAKRAKADAKGNADKKDGKDEKKDDKDRKPASDARERDSSTEVPLVTDEDDEVVAGGEFVAPVSAESNGLTGTDAALLAVGGLCAAGLAASAVVMARRRRL